MKHYFAFFSAVILALTISACETRNDGTADNRGDQTIGDAGDRAADRTGENLDRGADNLGDAFNDAAEWTEDTWNENVNNLKSMTYDQRDQYKERVGNILDRFEDRLDNWGKNQTATGTTTTTPNRPTAVNDRVKTDLQKRIDNIRDRVDKLDDATQTNWTRMKNDIDKSIADLQQSFRKNSVPMMTTDKTGTETTTPDRTGTGTTGNTGGGY